MQGSRSVSTQEVGGPEQCSPSCSVRRAANGVTSAGHLAAACAQFAQQYVAQNAPHVTRIIERTVAGCIQAVQNGKEDEGGAQAFMDNDSTLIWCVSLVNGESVRDHLCT